MSMTLYILVSVAEIRKVLRNLHDSETEDGCPVDFYTMMCENI